MTALRPLPNAAAAVDEKSDIAANLQAHAAAARGAYARNTERALQADIALFTGWCAAAGQPALPATPETVAAFIDAMAVSRAPASVRRYVASVATFHRAAGLANPCTAQTVTLALKRMHRDRGRAQVQAAPLTDHLVATLLSKAGPTLRDQRNKALLAVAYVTLCRRAELVALAYEDLAIGADGFATVVIRRGKTDSEGHGAVAPITADALRHLQTWLDAAGIREGLMFRAVLKGGRLGGALNGGEVARIYKSMAQQAELAADLCVQISGHSTRVGAAQDLLRYGEQLPAIMQAGRWQTAQMVARYTAQQNARSSASARIVGRRVAF